MAIDRIGKGAGGVEPPKETGGTAKPEKSFEVRTERTSTAAPSGAVEGAGASPLDRLRTGEIDVNGYVDLKLEEATAHLHGLGSEQLAMIKDVLRDQMATDPALLDLVKQATGSVPSLPED